MSIEVLESETKLFQIENSNYNRVVVQCKICKEIFTRESTNIKLPHSCNTYTIRNNEIYKLCKHCKKYKILKQFPVSNNSFDGYADYCGDRYDDYLLTADTTYLCEKPVRLEIVLDHKDAKIPTRVRSTDAGYDIYSIDNYVLIPGAFVKVKTGIKVCAPDGYYYSIEGRSSLWSKGIIPFRGIIDATFQGELFVTLQNIGDQEYQINSGDRVAQLILHKIIHADFIQLPFFTPIENGRATNAFGSTGR